MRLFRKKDRKEENSVNWNSLQDVSQLDTIEKNSNVKTQLIFKHSTRCGISRMVLRSFEKTLKNTNPNIDLFQLDLLNYRGISNEIEKKYQVIHESPQVIIVRNEVAVVNASHHDITQLNLERYE